MHILIIIILDSLVNFICFGEFRYLSITFLITMFQGTIKLATKSGNGFKPSFQHSVAGCYKDVAECRTDKTGVIVDKYRRGIDTVIRCMKKIRLNFLRYQGQSMLR